MRRKNLNTIKEKDDSSKKQAWEPPCGGHMSLEAQNRLDLHQLAMGGDAASSKKFHRKAGRQPRISDQMKKSKTGFGRAKGSGKTAGEGGARATYRLLQCWPSRGR